MRKNAFKEFEKIVTRPDVRLKVRGQNDSPLYQVAICESSNWHATFKRRLWTIVWFVNGQRFIHICDAATVVRKFVPTNPDLLPDWEAATTTEKMLAEFQASDMNYIMERQVGGNRRAAAN
jgi:hypothetical protein